MLKINLGLILVILLSACTSKEYTTKLCSGRIENFDEKVVQKQVYYTLKYLIDDGAVKVTFGGKEINAEFLPSEAQKIPLIHNIDSQYFVYLLDQTGMIEYELNPDRWFVGSCK